MNNSAYEKISKSTKPRVHIKYEVETENGTQEKELPFVIGVIGDFSANNTEQPSLKEREFTNIDRDNFDEVMAKIKPKLSIKIENSLDPNNDQLMPLELSFNSISDFEPDQLINQIEPLFKLKLARDRLRSLLNHSECSESLEKALESVLSDHKELEKLAKKIQTEE